MSGINRLKATGILMAASTVAFAIAAYGAQATGQGSGAKDPTAMISFDRAGVGGREGCEIQSWPDIAPECIAASGDAPAKVIRRLL